MRGAHGMMWWTLFGLLSSSCCALQLVLNMFNFGCAGFNTYLGPLRPAFLALTITLQIKMWELAVPNLGLPSTPEYYLPSCIISTVLTTFLSLLPELTAFRNSRLESSASASQGAAFTGTLWEIVLSLEGLGCVACTSAVHGAIKSTKKVVTSIVALEEKEARITLMCDEAEARQSIVPALIEQIQTAGFEATLQSMAKAEASASSAAKAEDVNCGPMSAVIAGLLSSSCCLLQLGVNLLATFNIVNIGCAGFNKVLGPWRTHLRALTFAWLGYLWFGTLRSRDCCKPKRGRLLCNTILCLGLSFLPELLRWSGGPAIAPPTEGAKVLKLKVDGMGCEACEAHVRGVMDRSSGVISSHADFQKGIAQVEIADNWNFNISTVLKMLENDGYEAEVVEKL